MDREKLAQGGLSLGHRQSWCKETLAIPLEEGEKVILLKRLCSFLGRHASIFTLAGSVRCLCLTEKSLHTGFLWGALLPWLEAKPWENDSRRRVTADDNINIWEWERHPGKKVKAVCSQEQLRGAHCGTVKQTNKRGNRPQTTLQSSVKARRLSRIK